MRRTLLSVIVLLLFGLGAAACGDDDDTSSPDETIEVDQTDATDDTSGDVAADEGVTDDETEEFDQGSDDALAAIEDLVASGLEADYGVAEVSCPVEITEAPDVYDCDATFEDGTTAVVTVSTEGGNVEIVEVSAA